MQAREPVQARVRVREWEQAQAREPQRAWGPVQARGPVQVRVRGSGQEQAQVREPQQAPLTHRLPHLPLQSRCPPAPCLQPEPEFR